jgi:Holliday junction resolvasome RuvABC DNA-binding subunit
MPGPADVPGADDLAVQEAERALVTLGYRAQEAARLVASIRSEADTAEQLVRAALRRVARQTEAAS